MTKAAVEPAFKAPAPLVGLGDADVPVAEAVAFLAPEAVAAVVAVAVAVAAAVVEAAAVVGLTPLIVN